MATTFTKLISLIAYDAALTERTDDFYLRAKTMPTTLTLRDIAEEVALRLNRNADEIYTILNDAERVKAEAVVSSYIVSTPTALMRPCASGTVLKADLSQAVDHTKVKVYASLSMGSLLREEMDSCRLELFTQPAVTGPLLNGAVAQTRTATGAATTRAPQAGKNLRLTGRNIKLVGEDSSVGITFTSVENPSKSVFVPLEDVTVNEPKQLIFVLPAGVTDGLWRVKVTTQYSTGNKPLAKTRSYELDEPLAVGSAFQAPDAGGSSSSGGGSGSSGGGSGPDGSDVDNPLG